MDQLERALNEAVATLFDLPKDKIREALNDRATNAFSCEGREREWRLDFNARLVTELRLADVWPKRKRGESDCAAD
jgi:hypothetical protein